MTKSYIYHINVKILSTSNEKREEKKMWAETYGIAMWPRGHEKRLAKRLWWGIKVRGEAKTIRKMKTEGQSQTRVGNDVTNSSQIAMRSRGAGKKSYKSGSDWKAKPGHSKAYPATIRQQMSAGPNSPIRIRRGATCFCSIFVIICF